MTASRPLVVVDSEAPDGTHTTRVFDDRKQAAEFMNAQQLVGFRVKWWEL